MIRYTTVGATDKERAKKFYCGRFQDQGASVQIDAGRIGMIGAAADEPMIAVCQPFNREAPQCGNGIMVAFASKPEAEVDAAHARAISLGATDEGASGQRIPDRFCGASVRDLDNNKLCFFVFG